MEPTNGSVKRAAGGMAVVVMVAQALAELVDNYFPGSRQQVEILTTTVLAAGLAALGRELRNRGIWLGALL